MSEPKDPRELLAMVTPKVLHFSVAPGGQGLTGIDIAHALSGIADPNARLYARVKYAGQYMFLDELAHVLRRRACMELDVGSWRLPSIKYPNGTTKARKGFILDMCMLALAEDFKPSLCTWCAGNGQHLIESGAYQQCSACKGSGHMRILNMDRAQVMNLTPQSWSQTWSERYRGIQGIIDKWDDKLPGGIGKRLSFSDRSLALSGEEKKA